MHFVITAQATSHIVLLATRDTITLSLLALEFASGGTAQREEAGIIGLIIVARLNSRPGLLVQAGVLNGQCDSGGQISREPLVAIAKLWCVRTEAAQRTCV
jgi:hypothetical protein